ncbi:MAG: RIP metalloprotease RseP [Haliscomenobacter sp.]|nr:RIP metalloprotease RseP [Haliscomenobacter sp.]MDX2068779.1 RIP metalloprotease RseP [Haliscomenobacter sp.]
MAGQLFLSLSILIVLHEMGHFFPARWFKTRVEKFYLFFDPWFSLFKIKKGETEYGIGWLPLGGYVKISGMIDESMDREQMAGPPQPWEFRSKPAWQRLIIMLGGVTVNFILGFFLYGMVLWTWGESFLPSQNAKYGIAVSKLGAELGLKDGDNVLAINGKKLKEFGDNLVRREIVINNAKNLEIERNGEKISLPIDPKFVKILSSYDSKDEGLYGLRAPFVIGVIGKKSPAEKAKLQLKDQIIAVNGKSTPYYHQVTKIVVQLKEKPIKLTILRNKKDTLIFPLTTTKEGKIGVGNSYEDFDFDTKKYTLGQALPAGVKAGVRFLGDQMKAYGQMFRGNIDFKESVGGFGSIATMFGDIWSWERFWRMTAVLSLVLAFMNLLPIPALDGGHVMFLLYEIVSGRKPSDKFMEYATILGFIIVIGLVLFANGLDIFRLFK